MPRFSQHELLDLQEHIRSEAAFAENCRQFALTVTDPDLQAFCAEEARVADQNASRLMAHFQGSGAQ
ncbi:MAG TPA: hypothetical protein VNT75_01315 [Symbiobacteriaceae bacterium]|nr:hypothetical protein [Symbiobacteriaceae bacterium]